MENSTLDYSLEDAIADSSYGRPIDRLYFITGQTKAVRIFFFSDEKKHRKNENKKKRKRKDKAKFVGKV